MLWTALAECLASPEAGGLNRDKPRIRGQTKREGFVPSSQIQSSPSFPSMQSNEPRSSDSEDESTASQGSSYHAGSSNGSEVDEDQHTDQTKSEVITVNLALAFIRYVLNFCAGQKPKAGSMVKFRGELIRERNTENALKFDATDDGSIWDVWTNMPGKVPWEWGKRLAILEAAKAFHHIDRENRAVVSDANWAQYTCEALTACLTVMWPVHFVHTR